MASQNSIVSDENSFTDIRATCESMSIIIKVHCNGRDANNHAHGNLKYLFLLSKIEKISNNIKLIQDSNTSFQGLCIFY